MTEQTKKSPWKPLYLPAIAERLLAKEQCEAVIEAANDLGFKLTSVLGGQRLDVRRCEAVTLGPEAHSHIYDFAAAAIKTVNNEQYRFGLVGLEPIQVIRYEKGSFFREHSDLSYQHDYAAGRKISLITQLTDGDSYEGGRLVLFGEEEMPRTQGTTCVFPAWLPHRVEELTAGTRYTLVAWAKGPPFN